MAFELFSVEISKYLKLENRALLRTNEMDISAALWAL